jgi:hypothetical protein
MVTVDSVSYSLSQLPVSFSSTNGSLHSFAFQSPLVVGANSRQYVWMSTTGLSSLQSGSITVSTNGSIIGDYKTQYYLTVTSPYDSPSPSSGWFDSGSSITESVTSPVSGGSGVQYVCTGWTGSGSVPASGSGSSVTFTINAASAIAWGWKTQYYFTVTSPYDSPSPVSGWFDSGSSITESVTSPVSGGSGIQYACTGWTGTGSVPSSGISPSLTFTIGTPSSMVWNWKTRYQITFGQTGVSSDWSGTVVTVDGVNYGVSDLPFQFWFDNGSGHGFSFATPLIVNASVQYNWTSTSGLTTAQSGTLTITASGSVTGNYVFQNTSVLVVFDQSGVDPDFSGQVVNIDGIDFWTATHSTVETMLTSNYGTTHSNCGVFSTVWFSQGFMVLGPEGNYNLTHIEMLFSRQPLPPRYTANGSYVMSLRNQDSMGRPIGSDLATAYVPIDMVPTDGTTTLVDFVFSPTLTLNTSVGYTFILRYPNFSDPTTSDTSWVGSYTPPYDVNGLGSRYSISWSEDSGTTWTVTSDQHPWFKLYGSVQVPKLPVTFSWNIGSIHNFSYYSPLTVNASRQYTWVSTTGISTIQNGTITITASGSVIGNYIARAIYNVTISAQCNTEGVDISVPITIDGSSSGYSTAYTFTGLTGSHTFTVPNTDANGDPFLQWSAGQTSTTITVTGGGTYTAYYQGSAGVHDVALTNITSYKTVVGQGYGGNMSVIVENNGNYTETVPITVYANTTIFGSQNVTLSEGNSITIFFSWNTTGFAYGNFTLSAYALPVPGETNTADNNCTCNVPVHVGVPGDVSGSVLGAYDKIVDMKDIAYIVSLFNTKPSSPNWNPNADINNDGVVNMKDVAIAVLYFHQHE